MSVVTVKGSAIRKLQRGYPWLQRSDVRWESDVAPGSLAELCGADGTRLGMGLVNPGARYPVKILRLGDGGVDGAFFRDRLDRAWDYRQTIDLESDAFRWAHGEADGLPGLIVDFFAGHAVVQVRNLGMEKLKPVWLPILAERCESVFERSDMQGRKEEGMEEFSGQLAGETPERIEIRERGLRYLVPAKDGLKTGHFLDQRNSRAHLAKQVRQGDRVLDLFCYTGGFSLAAASAGADCLGVDIKQLPVLCGQANAQLNGLTVEFVQANAFDYLAESAEGGYNWIILDPPAIAKTRDKRDSLKWGIWKLVHDALPHLNPGGRVVVCACTWQMGIEDCWDVVQLAAGDCGVKVALEAVTLQDRDHPAVAEFPQSLYLKCLWVRRME
ncbi:MAG: class I SAM-dependent rRNA methyltransferase [Armatimonadetes bacterium]|nr:class I SAM-dependent rRNA methyltransferase [Armatimonadota bacterium]